MRFKYSTLTRTLTVFGSMKVRIKTVNGGIGLPSNLKTNAVYQATRINNDQMKVVCNDGQVITTSISKSGYLGDFGEWEIVEETKADTEALDG